MTKQNSDNTPSVHTIPEDGTTSKVIINVGRQIGSGGRIIARMLAEDFQARFYDKELLDLAAAESGFSKKFFEQNDEQKGFFRHRFNLHLPLVGEQSFYGNNFSQESLYKFQSDAIHKAAAEEGNVVFVGRTADYILRDRNDIVNIFITANLEERIAAVMERHHISHEEARKYISNKESARASYYNYYTGKRWGSSESYDLCINSSLMGLEQTARFIADFVRKVTHCQTTKA